MERRGRAGIAAVLLVLMLVHCCWAQDSGWENVSNGSTGVTAVCAVEGGLPAVLIGTRYGISRSEDAGVNWKNVVRLRGQAAQVNSISAYGQDVYAATSAGLYYSPNGGVRWERMYRGADELSRSCYGVRATGQTILAGSEAGLLISDDRGVSWHKADGRLGQQRIVALEQSKTKQEVFCAATAHSVYVSRDNARTWSVVYARAVNGDDRKEEEEPGENEEMYDSAVRAVCFDPLDDALLYIGLRRHVEYSGDSGRSWQRLPDAGLVTKDIQDIGFVNKRLNVASGNRLFEYDQQRWVETGQRLSAGRLNKIAVGNQGSVYIAAERGLFVSVAQSRTEKEEKNNHNNEYGGIPDIRFLQQAAIEYAEVDMEKIRDWRRHASRKAWLPSVNVGIDRDTSELWHWEGGSTTKAQDDELRRGKEAVGWDISLSWDLGDLIWSDDQTSIDTRSRLLVQLRNEILDEVNKLYFEYVRTRTELDDLSTADSRKAAEKRLRLAELAASLNGLTGGQFSTARPGLLVDNSVGR